VLALMGNDGEKDALESTVCRRFYTSPDHAYGTDVVHGVRRVPLLGPIIMWDPGQPSIEYPPSLAHIWSTFTFSPKRSWEAILLQAN